MTPLLDAVWRRRAWIVGGVAILCLANVIAVAAAYLAYPGYLDHGEPSVALISWGVLHGNEAYPSLDSPGQVANIYGPFAFLIHALVFAVAGGTMAAGKAASLAAAVALPIVVFLTHRRDGAALAVAGAIAACGYILLTVHTSLWNRPDSSLALVAALAVWAANAANRTDRPWAGAIAVGLCGGVAVGLKIHGGIYVLPAAVLLGARQGWRPFLAAGVVGVVVTLLPFLSAAFPLDTYLAWFPRMAGKETSAAMLANTGKKALLYVVPALFFVAALGWADRRPDRAEALYVAAFLVSVALAFPVAAKPGAGTYYLFPFAPVAIDVMLRNARRVRAPRHVVGAAVGLVAAVAMVVSVPVQRRYLRNLHWERSAAITAEIRAIMAAYPGRTIEMGTGESLAGYLTTFQKTLLVFAGHPYTLETAVLFEFSALGIPLTESTLNLVRTCNTDVWLVPRGERPFAMVGYYGVPPYDEAFRRAFTESYRRDRSFSFFDAWTCRADRPGRDGGHSGATPS